jgi:hypothetical protein
MGTDKAAKAAGFPNFKAFFESYGLRLHNPEDVDEGREMLKGMGFKLHY